MSQPISGQVSRPVRVLDLACGAGSASDGYAMALLSHGYDFEITGVDIRPQPHYPYDFIQGDALDFLDPGVLDEFDLVHGSFPCQLYSQLRHLRKAQGRAPGPRATDVLERALPFFRSWNGLWIMENVPGAPLEKPIRMCGTAWDHLGVRRHRYFELSPRLRGLAKSTLCQHWRKPPAVGVYGWQGDHDGATHKVAKSVMAAREAMGIERDMSWQETVEAIPPVYTEYILSQLLDNGILSR